MTIQNLIQAGLIRLTITSNTLISYILLKRHIFQVITAAVFTFAVPLAAQAAPEAGGIGSGRLLPTAVAVIGIIGIIIGRQARARTNNGRTRAIIAIVFGLISLIVGGLHAAYSAGGFGTGNGRAGAIVALAVGFASVVLGLLALIRQAARRSGTTATAEK